MVSDSVELNAKFRAAHKLPFPLLSDADCAAINVYGVFASDDAKGRRIARPSTFVVDMDGVTRWRYVGKAAAERPPLDIVLAQAKATAVRLPETRR